MMPTKLKNFSQLSLKLIAGLCVASAFSICFITPSLALTIDQALKQTQNNPNSSINWQELGDAYKKNQEYQKASEAYKKSVAINRNNFHSWFYLGNVYQALQNYPEAITAHYYVTTQGEHVYSYHYNAAYNLGLSFSKISDFAMAAFYYKQSIKKYPKHGSAHINLGLMYHYMDQILKAEQTYLAGIKISPKEYLLHNNLGNIYLDRGDFINAKGSFEKAVRINHKKEIAWNNLALTQRKMSLYNDGIKTIEKALKNVTPSSEGLYNLMGFMYHDLKQYNKALEWYNTSISNFPNQYSAYYNKGNIKVIQGHYQQAVEQFKKSVSYNPSYVDAYIQLAYLYHDMNQKDLGRKAFEKVMQLDPVAAKPLKKYYP